jgi:hypothetical protein
LPPDAWNFSINLNLTSMYRMIARCCPACWKRVAQHHQHVVGCIQHPRHAKPLRLRRDESGVIGLTKSVAADYVRAASDATRSVRHRRDPVARRPHNAFDDPVAARGDFIKRQPMGRLGTTQETPHSRSSSHRMNRRTRPARFTSSTVAGACSAMRPVAKLIACAILSLSVQRRNAIRSHRSASRRRRSPRSIRLQRRCSAPR